VRGSKSIRISYEKHFFYSFKTKMISN